MAGRARGLGQLVLAAVLLITPSTRAQDTGGAEYRAKATFLAAFPNFVEWPANAFPSEEAPLLICVYGHFSFGTSLAEMTRGASIRGRRVEVKWTRKEQELRTCQILFVSQSEENQYGKIFKAIQGASVLTVGETPDFLGSGGAIDFSFEQDKLQFEVNIGAANDAHLRISSNMLALARHVISKIEAAKS
jgi:YfiR/HmsC-like